MQRSITMKLFRKTVALLMAIALATSSLAGCSGNSDSSSDTSSTATNSSTTSTASDTGTSSTGEEASASALPFDETLTVTMMISENATQPVNPDSSLIQYMKEHLNVDLQLQIIPGSDYATRVATALASNSMPDMIRACQPYQFSQYAPTGMLLNIDDYKEYAPDYYALIDGEDRIGETNKLRINGSMYGFETLEYYRVAIAPINAIRTDLLEEAGLDMPTTWDEFYDALLAIKEKHPDMTGFSSRAGTRTMIGRYAYQLGSGGFNVVDTTNGVYYEPEEDAYIYGPTSENFKAVIEFFAQAYKDGILDPDYATMTQETYWEKLSSGRTMSICDNNSFIGRVFNPALEQIDENAAFDIVPPLENDLGQTRQYRYNKDWTDQIIVSSQVDEPEKVVQFLNWFYTDEGRMLTNFGVEGQDYDIVDGNPMIKQEIVDANSDASDVFTAIQGELGLGLQGLATYVDEYTYHQVSDPIFLEQAEKIDQYTEDGSIVYAPLYPSLSQEDNERATSLQANLNNVFDQEIDKFIIGQRSMDEWDDFVATLESQGASELAEIYNNAYQALQE